MSDRPEPIHIEDRPNAIHFKHIIHKDLMHETQLIKDIDVVSIMWVGAGVYQPALKATSPTEKWQTPHLSYEGYAHYLPPYAGSFPHIQTDHIVMPNNGQVQKMRHDELYFFNSYDPASHDKRYALNKNNTSIIINNASIYDETYNIGAMVNMRASFDGLTNDEIIGGNVIILCSIDWINLDNIRK